MMLAGMTLAALVLGVFLPLRWGFWGFLGAAAALFVVQAGIRTAGGYEGLAFADTMLLFNNSWASYVGYNLQVTNRAFALPLFVFAAPFVWRMSRRG